jgi:hypothetical protein
MSLIDELLEISPEDKDIVKSFQTKETLSDAIFKKENDEYIMHQDVRKKLLDISDNFIDSLGVEFFVHDILLMGSLANYNWSKYSDVDLHIVVDMNEFGDNNSKSLKKIFQEFFDAKKDVWNDLHNIKIKNYDVEIYAQDINHEAVSAGIYSVLNDKWLSKPEKKKLDIDENKILKKAQEYITRIDKLEKESYYKDVTAQLINFKNKLKNLRKIGLETGGEYSYENFIFKLLRRNGYITKLFDIKSNLIDKKLSIAD